MSSTPSPPQSPPSFLGSLRSRVLLLALILFLEKFALNFFVDFTSAQSAVGFGAVVRVAQHVTFRFLVTFAITMFVFQYVLAASNQVASSRTRALPPINLVALGAHLLLLWPLALLSHDLYGQSAPLLPFAATALLWVVFAMAAILAAFKAMAPWILWRQSALELGTTWIYGFLAALVAAIAIEWFDRLWEPTAKLTFQLATRLLRPLTDHLSADPATLTLQTDHFAVRIAEVCSGLEGIGLMVVFCVAWLLLFRREYRFPRALLVIPIGIFLVFALNVVRIAALVMIGDAGYRDIAQYGFHSQAGWIAFNLAACAVALVSRRISWLTTDSEYAQDREENVTATYVLPFLFVLGAGMVSLALSGGFENFYGLRLIAGAAVLLAVSARLGREDWRFSWRGVGVGSLVSLIWVAGAHWTLVPRSVPIALTQMTPGLRVSWIAIRLLTSVSVVPVAEELAYRGYLMRRLMNPAFESLPYRAVRWPALLISSLVFGVGHGSMWIAGSVAGLLYAELLRRTEKIGESVIAHATTNALLALAAIASGHWELM